MLYVVYHSDSQKGEINIEISELSNNDLVSLALGNFKNKLGFFYVVLSSYFDIRYNDDGHTGCATYNPFTKTFVIDINISDVRKYPKPLDMLTGLLLHEVLHIIMNHFTRKVVVNYNKRNKRLTNIILDCQINGIVKDILDINMEKGWFFDNLKEGYSEDLYSPIEVHLENFKHLYDQHQDDNGGGDYTNHPIDEEFDEVREDVIAKSAGSLVEDAQKKAGNKATGFERLLNGLYKPKKRILIPSIMNGLREAYKRSDLKTYTKYNKFSDSYGYVKPYFYNKSEGKAVVAIDISGSIDEETYKVICSKVTGIDNDIDVIFWSSEDKLEDFVPQNVHTNFKKSEIVKLNPVSYGGTDIAMLFNLITEKYKKQKVSLCVFTDMEFGFRQPSPNLDKLYFFSTVKGSNELAGEYAKCVTTKYYDIIDKW